MKRGARALHAPLERIVTLRPESKDYAGISRSAAVGRAKEHSVFAQNQTRLGVVSVARARRAREIVQHCLGPRAAWGRRRAQREYSATLVDLAGGIRPASAEARGAIEHAATTHHHGAETIVPAPESVDHGLSPRATRRRRRGQRKHCAANTAIDSSGIGRAVEHAAAADRQAGGGGPVGGISLETVQHSRNPGATGRRGW